MLERLYEPWQPCPAWAEGAWRFKQQTDLGGEPWFSVPREEWGAGPWREEPDRVEWRAHGRLTLMARNSYGAWCGYVGVEPDHPWRVQNYNDIGANVHGGVTFGAASGGMIGHSAEPAGGVWWIGFDCVHFMDYAPAMAALLRHLRTTSPLAAQRPEDFRQRMFDTYRHLEGVRRETERLALQAAEVIPRVNAIIEPLLPRSEVEKTRAPTGEEGDDDAF
jgi:hypothetical protein